MAEYSNPKGIIPRLMAAAHRWQSRGGRAPADEGSIPLSRGATREERIANARVLAAEEEAAKHPVLSALGFTDGPAGPVKAMFMGAMARHAPIDRMYKAQAMSNAGKSAEKIYRATTAQRPGGDILPGISFGKDGMQRWEITDSRARLNPDVLQRLPRLDDTTPPVQLAELLQHPELYRNYPHLREMNIGALPENTSYYGEQHPGRNLLLLNKERSPEAVRSTLLHEIQHEIQDVEGWSRGGNAADVARRVAPLAKPDQERYDRFLDAIAKVTNGDREKARQLSNTPHGHKLFLDYYRWKDPDEMRRLYMRLAGETEARNVQTRRFMTPLQLFQKMPHETEDIPRARQILNMED